MKLIIKESCEEFYNEAAAEVSRQVITKQDSVIGLATGNTTVGIYRSMVRMHKAFNIDYSRVTTINLDEYVGINPSLLVSCYSRICKDLLNDINIDKSNIYVPNGMTEPIEKECDTFEHKLVACGGIDLQILSIGENGHIAFNEPGTAFDTKIHIADIANTTVEAKAALFGSKEKVPRKGITMGIRTIMMAKKIMLVANGRSKADIIYKTLFGPVTEDIPSSVLQLHSELVVVLDKEAALAIKQKCC